MKFIFSRSCCLLTSILVDFFISSLFCSRPVRLGLVCVCVCDCVFTVTIARSTRILHIIIIIIIIIIELKLNNKAGILGDSGKTLFSLSPLFSFRSHLQTNFNVNLLIYKGKFTSSSFEVFFFYFSR